MKNFLLLTCLLASLQAHSQAVGQVKLEHDFFTGAPSANPGGLTVFNGKLALRAGTGVVQGGHGYELYAYDANGVATLFDVNPGTQDGIQTTATPFNMVAIGNTLYLAANDGTTGQELYKWDGTTQPTLAYDLNSGALGSDPYGLATLNGKLYFAASTPATGIELWVYDPATSSAQLVSDVYGGATDAYPRNLTAFNGKLYFTARNAATSFELFVHDPVANTTNMVVDYYPGFFGANPTSLLVVNNKLYFQANDGVHGRELHVMDAAQTITRLTDIEPSITNGGIHGGHDYYMQMAVHNNNLFVLGSDGATGQALYKYDLAASSLTKLATLNTAPSTAPTISPTCFASYAGKLFFNGDDGVHGPELWVYDGVNAPYMVADTDPGISGGYPMDMTVFNSKLYFTAAHSANTGIELYSFTDSSLSIKSVSFDGNINAVPNPAGNVFNISLSLAKATSLSISINGIDGRQQFAAPLRHYEAGSSTVTFDASALPAGIYLYAVKNEDGTLCQSGRIVKQ